MTDILMLILTLAPSILLVAGACAVAVWAARLPDEQSSIVARLTADKEGSGAQANPPPTELIEKRITCAISD
jgi:hypothetical protein